MNKDIADKWVAALRSGEFAQGDNRLRGTAADDYCCLGVLSELAAREGIVTRTAFGPAWMYGNTSSFLPYSVRMWAGMADDMGGFGSGPDDNLVFLNDNGSPFTYIADVIEQKWQNL